MAPSSNGWEDTRESEREALDQWEEAHALQLIAESAGLGSARIAYDATQQGGDAVNHTDHAIAADVQALATYYGWELQTTGGGCDTLQKEIPNSDGGYWLITEAEGCNVPPNAYSPVMLGAYDADGEARQIVPTSFHCLLLAMLDVDCSLRWTPQD